MRTIIVLVALFALGQCATQKEYPLEDILERQGNSRILEPQINSTLECVKQLLINGDEEIGIPSFDPLELFDLSVDLGALNIANVSGILALSDFKIGGVPKWKLTELKVNYELAIKIKIAIEWPLQDMTGNYKGDISILGHKFNGEGKVTGSLTNNAIQIDLKTTFALVPLPPYKIDKLSIKPSIEKIVLEATELFYNGADITNEISEIASSLSSLINNNVETIDKTLSDAIKKLVNDAGGISLPSGGGGIIGDIAKMILDKCPLSTKKSA